MNTFLIADVISEANETGVTAMFVALVSMALTGIVLGLVANREGE